jgi:hypothetical protein
MNSSACHIHHETIKEDKFVPKVAVSTYIKENRVTVGISIISINPVKSLGKLDITHCSSKIRIH